MTQQQIQQLATMTTVYVIRQESPKTRPYIELRDFVRYAPKEDEPLSVEHSDIALPGCKAWAAEEDVFTSWDEAKNSERFHCKLNCFIQDAERQIENIQASIQKAKAEMESLRQPA